MSFSFDRFTPSQQLRVGLICGLLGLTFGIRAPIGMGLLIASCCLGLYILWRKWFFLVLIIGGLALSYSAARVQYDITADKMRTFVGRTTTIEGTIARFPDRRRTSTQLTINTTKPEVGKLLLVLPPEVDATIGDSVTATGKIRAPQNFGGFEYRQYLSRIGIRSLLQQPATYGIISTTQKTGLLGFAHTIRAQVQRTLQTHLPEPHATLVLGILAGVRDPLPAFTQDAFQKSGLSHLLVVSGVNIVYVVLLLYWLFSWSPRWLRFIVALLGVLIYALVTGADAPVIRASLMGLIAGLATATGDQNDSRIALLLSLVLIGVVQPLMLRFDPGLHLSALATAGIIFFHADVTKYLKWMPNWLGIRTILGVTLSAQIALIPLLVLQFETWPIASIIANIIAEPFVPIVMFGGIVLALIGGALPFFWGKILAIPTYLATEGLSGLATIFAMIPAITIPPLIAKTWLIIMGIIFLWMTIRLAPGREISHTYDR